MIILVNEYVCLEIHGIDREEQPFMTFVQTCQLCGEELTRNIVDVRDHERSSDEEIGAYGWDIGNDCAEYALAHLHVRHHIEPPS